MLDERAAPRVGERPRHRERVAFHDDVKIVGVVGAAEPGVADEPAGHVRRRAERRRQVPGRGQQFEGVGVEHALDARPQRDRRSGRRAPHDAERPAPVDDDHGRGPRGQRAAHVDLPGAGGQRGQRAREAAHGEISHAKRVGPGEVVAKDEVARAGGQHVHAAPARQAQGVGRGQRRRHGHDRAIHEVGGGRRHLRIALRAPGHHRALGWKSRYMRFSAALGRCV